MPAAARERSCAPFGITTGSRPPGVRPLLARLAAQNTTFGAKRFVRISRVSGVTPDLCDPATVSESFQSDWYARLDDSQRICESYSSEMAKPLIGEESQLLRPDRSRVLMPSLQSGEPNEFKPCATGTLRAIVPWCPDLERPRPTAASCHIPVAAPMRSPHHPNPSPESASRSPRTHSTNPDPGAMERPGILTSKHRKE